MATEIVPTTVNFDGLPDFVIITVSPEVQFSVSDLVPLKDEYSAEKIFNKTELQQVYSDYSPLFEIFTILELVMTTLELSISILAVVKMPRWRRNYRNQMLLQLSIARFIKRVIFTVKFLEDQNYISPSDDINNTLSSSQIYIDFVIVILVFFFIRHMYNTIIVVLVKIRQNHLCKAICWSWLIPVPITVVSTIVIVTQVTDKWTVYLIICTVFRWPLILIGTGLYVTILYNVLSDQIRHFARSLTVVTFFLCLLINIYLFSKDVIELWCLESFTTILISNVSGFLMNCFILSMYVILIMLTFNMKIQSTDHLDKSLPDFSIAEINMKRTTLIM